MPVHRIVGGYANTYVIEDGDSLAAVDVGTAKAAKNIHRYLLHQSRDAASLRMVTATHFHIDHIGGIAKLIELFPTIRICFFAMVEDYLNGKEKICLFSSSAWIKALLPILIAEDNHVKNTAAALFSSKAGIPLPFLRTKFLPSDYQAECILRENQPIPYLPHWKLIETPGHTDDSICFYSPDEKTLISGDTILNISGSGELNKFCCNQQEILQSFETLLSLTIKKIYPGHGSPLCNLDGLDGITR
jgi:glyoxylase-like metal-dependent hydrolase (beta-lactamase superfamily II)